MATQLLFTLRDLTSSGVDEVELLRSNGSQLCVLDENRADSVVPAVTASTTPTTSISWTTVTGWCG